MAGFILNDAELYLGPTSFGGEMSAMAINTGADLKEATVMGDTHRQRRGGLKSTDLQFEGYVLGFNSSDNQQYSKVAVNQPATIIPNGVAVGNVAYGLDQVNGSYQHGGQVGEMYAYTVTGQSSSRLVKGEILEAGSKSTTGFSTGNQLGAVPSGSKFFAAVHVVGTSGTSPTLDVQIQRDDNSGFGSPSSYVIFNQFTANGSASFISSTTTTDDWFRVSYVIGGTTPSFNFLVFAGVFVDG